MIQTENATPLLTWSAAECPFAIEYSPSALDDVRLAVVDAFFSLPRGGAEIGGVLFGDWDGQRLSITDYKPLDCEHAFGPSFTLSPKDETVLAELLAAGHENGARPVGWYHSHTRSEIFLSEADQEIHRKFFPEPWQVALVLRPHAYQPTRAGFFFRGADGSIHGEATYNEFVLTPLSVKPAPTGAPPANEPVTISRVDEEPAEESDAQPAPAPPSKPRPLFDSGPAPEPRFAANQSEEVDEEPIAAPAAARTGEPSGYRPKRLPTMILALFAASALGVAAYLWRDVWFPSPATVSAQRPAATAPAAIPLGLNTIDTKGQLQIFWNPNSQVVQKATGGVLRIETGGPVPQDILLDKAHLLSGTFTFARQTARVDITMNLTQPDRRHFTEGTAFVGKVPETKAAAQPVEDPAVKAERDQLAKQVAKMQADLNAEISRNESLKKTVDQLSKQLHDQQRSRLMNQIPDRK